MVVKMAHPQPKRDKYGNPIRATHIEPMGSATSVGAPPILGGGTPVGVEFLNHFPFLFRDPAVTIAEKLKILNKTIPQVEYILLCSELIRALQTLSDFCGSTACSFRHIEICNVSCDEDEEEEEEEEEERMMSPQKSTYDYMSPQTNK